MTDAGHLAETALASKPSYSLAVHLTTGERGITIKRKWRRNRRRMNKGRSRMKGRRLKRGQGKEGILVGGGTWREGGGRGGGRVVERGG